MLVICIKKFIASTFIILILSSCNFIPADKDYNNLSDLSVYFNSPHINNGNNIDLALIDMIDNANVSVDAHFYQCSRENIRDAFIRAKNRGVTVRFITDYHYYDIALYKEIFYNHIESAKIPLITETFCGRADTFESHNKFCITDNINVWTGSYNITDSGTLSNNNNAVLIRSQKIASIYTEEFNEMWGSRTETPNRDTSKFGGGVVYGKTDNTKHYAKINGADVFVYFSPSDNVKDKIIEVINSAEYSIYFAMFTFTDDDIGAAIKAKFDKGVKVYGIIDSSSAASVYSEYKESLSDLADIYVKKSSDAEKSGKIMHHKFVVIDVNTESDPIVITGSYNWTKKAEVDNDENIIIIHNNSIAVKYHEEFVKIFGKID